MFRNAGINLAFKLINMFLISKITNEPLKKFTEAQIEPLKDVADVLTDKNPNDADQLDEVWDEHKEQFVKDSTQVIREIIIMSVDDEEKEGVLLEIVDLLESELLNAFEDRG